MDYFLQVGLNNLSESGVKRTLDMNDDVHIPSQLGAMERAGSSGMEEVVEGSLGGVGGGSKGAAGTADDGDNVDHRGSKDVVDASGELALAASGAEEELATALQGQSKEQAPTEGTILEAQVVFVFYHVVSFSPPGTRLP